ncbi:MAG TPA: TolC family protein [Firmicutes bacterium]|nr:TolC family protein [Bacillota bacterium]
MGNRLLSGVAMTIISVLALCTWTTGATPISITLGDAVDLAFERNAQYQLSLWEYELVLEEQRLKDQEMTLNFSSTPLSIKNGQSQPATGNMMLAMPLGDHTTLTSRVSAHAKDMELDFGGSLNIEFKYDFFAAPKSTWRADVQSMLAVDNGLVVNVATTLINLAKELDKIALEELRLAYLEEAYQAAVVTDHQGQISQMRQQLYESEKRLANAQLLVSQHNQKLNHLLNMETAVDFRPVVDLKAYQMEYDQNQLIEWALAASSTRNQAISAVQNAESQLEATKRASGWSLSATANLDWNFDVSQTPTWSIGLNASKTLYPPSLQAEKDALKLAQAKLQLAEVELNIKTQITQLLDKLAALESQHRDIEEDLQAEEAELENSRKLYDVGLTTELKLKEHQLELARLQTNLRDNRCDYFTSLLQLFDLCGFELSIIVPELVY